MNININRMGIFNQVKGNGDDIVNLEKIGNGEGHELATKGKYRWYNPFRGIRSQKTIDANRLARETLLKNLRVTFGLQDDANFMVELKRRIGDEILKSDDFDADGDGKVRTNRPLTQRRVTAIMNRVKQLAELERQQAPQPVIDVTDEVVRRRQELLQVEVSDRFHQWLKSTRDVTVVDIDNDNVSSVRVIKDCSFFISGKRSEATLNMFKTLLDRTVAKLAMSGRPRVKFSSIRKELIIIRNSAGTTTEPFIGKGVLVDGCKMKGSNYYERLVTEKIDELIEEFNRNHPELALG